MRSCLSKQVVPGVASARLARPSFVGPSVVARVSLRVLARAGELLFFFSDDDAAVVAVDEGTYLVIPEVGSVDS